MTTDRNHDMSSDEVRRQLRSAQAEHEASMSAWKGSLDELLDPESGAGADEKAAFLGVPNRRTFMVGGVVLAGGALLAACAKKKTPQVPESGALPPVPGGIGPLPIAMLMVNTLTAATRRRGPATRTV